MTSLSHSHYDEQKCDVFHSSPCYSRHLVTSLWLSLCDKPPGKVTVYSPCDSHMTIILRLLGSNYVHSIVTRHQITPQCSYMVTLWWPKFGNRNSCEVTMRTEITRWLHFTVTWRLVTKQLSWSIYNGVQMTVRWESQGDFIVTSPEDSSQSNSHNDFSMESPNDVYLKLKVRRKKDITFWYIIVTVTFATICNVKIVFH